MYLAQDLRTEIHRIRSKFAGTMSYDKIIKILTPVLKKFRAKPLLLLSNIDKNSCAISGLFDTQIRRLPITIELTMSANGKSLRQSKKAWDNMLFDIFCILCHEHIHMCQKSFREPDEIDFYFELDDETKMTEEQKYFAELDEIDAYSYMIAQEILWQHKKADPFDILRNLKVSGILTYDMYQIKFENTKWFDIRNQLLKKTYRWLNDILENDWGYLSQGQ